MARYNLFLFTCILLLSSLVLSFLLYSTRSYMVTHDYASLAPVWLYPANILAWCRVAILISALCLAASRGGGWVDRIVKKKNNSHYYSLTQLYAQNNQVHIIQIINSSYYIYCVVEN